MAPTGQNAFFLESLGGEFAIKTTSVPVPGPGEVLVRVESAALNPLDWKIKAYSFPFLPQYPAILGCEGAGFVEELGEGVSGHVKGDRVLFQSDVGDVRNQAFQQYVSVPAHLAAKLPANLGFDEAASVPCGAAAAFLGLYNAKEPSVHLGFLDRKYQQGGAAGLAPFWEGKKHTSEPFVVLGGASSVGSMFAKLSGFSPIIVTASLHNEAHLKSLGATHVVPRTLTADELKGAIVAITQDKPIALVYDAISQPTTLRAGWSILAPGGQLVVVTPPDVEGVVNGDQGKHVRMVAGSPHWGGQTELGRVLYERLGEWLTDGSIKPNRVQVLPNGLKGIEEGLRLLQEGKVSGAKLIAHPQEGL